MRTTVSISDELLLAAKRLARRRGQTLGDLVDAALRRELTQPETLAARPEVPVFAGKGGLRASVDPASGRPPGTPAPRRRGLDALR